MICIVQMADKIVIAGHASDDICLIVSTVVNVAAAGGVAFLHDGYGEVKLTKTKRPLFRAVSQALRDVSLQFPGEVEWVARRKPERKEKLS